MAKYRNKRVFHEGMTFDSQMEYARYTQLKLLFNAGVIRDLNLHPIFKLQPKYYSASQRKNIPAITYKADFSYLEDGQIVVEDVKGFKTTAFNLKRRMFEYLYPKIKFVVVDRV